MAARERLICASGDLADGGAGVRFTVTRHGEAAAAFAVRYQGRVFAYLNACAHVPVELDWLEGAFFDVDGRHLICATHGALYEPESGYCVAGPCRGASLCALPVEEVDGEVWLLASGQ